MKVLFVGAEDEENLAIRYLAAVLKKDKHNILISPCTKEEDIKEVLNDIKRFKPDMVAISIAFQSLAKMFFKLISKINKDISVVIGGHFPTFEYETILEKVKNVDMVVRFEGEVPLSQLALRKDISKIPNIVYRIGDKIVQNKCVHKFPNLDKLPFPIREKEPQKRLGEKFATLAGSRGCFHSSCLYCCIGAFHSGKKGCKYALRSPGSIAEEIAQLYHKKGVRLFQFHDDNFMLPSKKDTLKRFKDMKNEIKNKGVDLDKVAFLIKARPDSIDKEIANVLQDLGVIGVFLGVENASDSGLKHLIRGSTRKHVDNAISILKNYNMTITFNLLLFHPNATLDEVNENIYFIKDHLNYPLDFGRAEIVAGSPLERQVVKDNLKTGSWPNWGYKIKDDSVRLLFDLNQLTFRRKGSNYSYLAHELIALSYRAHLLKRLYPGIISDEIYDKTESLIIKLNRFILKKLLEMYRLGVSAKSEKQIDKLYFSIRRGCKKILKESSRLSNKMNKLQILENTFYKLNAGSVQNSRMLRKLI